MIYTNRPARTDRLYRCATYPLALGALLALSACGSDEPAGSGVSASVPTAFNPFAAGYTCDTPVLSGSPEQQACFAKAQEQCPEDEPPGRTEFEQQPDGQYLIKGYVCG
jgi:hypothetical protein